MPYIVPDKVVEPLYAIVPLSNPWRWKARWKHVERSIKHFMDSGAVVVLVEVAFNRREFAFANSGLDGTPANCGVLGSDHRFRHRYIGLRSSHELWFKENQINIAVAQALPYDWQNMCWLDSDLLFLRPNWVGECIHKLQHYDFLQMFDHARDVGPNYRVLPGGYPHADGTSWVRWWLDGEPDFSEIAVRKGEDLAIDPKRRHKKKHHPYPPRVWPGLAWAATRRGFDAVGGLLDFAIWGGGDYHMAHCLIERKDGMMRNDLHPNYKMKVMEWFDRCQRHIRRNVGVMEGSVFHFWHGRKTDRGYNAKHAALARIGFDPLRHLKRDYQGLYQLNDDGSEGFVQMRDTLRRVAIERDEDSNDTRLDLWDQGH
jgi:hypothetical protein